MSPEHPTRKLLSRPKQGPEPIADENFGADLRDARVQSGRSLDDIARRTKIPTPVLERIERGDAAALPADVFVCGFLRAYAREVGQDGDAAVARFRRVRKAPGVNSAPELVAVNAEARQLEPASHRDETAPRIVLKEALVAGGAPDEESRGMVESILSHIPGVEAALGRGPTFALVVLLVVLVATITLSLLLGGDPSPGRGLS